MQKPIYVDRKGNAGSAPIMTVAEHQRRQTVRRGWRRIAWIVIAVAFAIAVLFWISLMRRYVG